MKKLLALLFTLALAMTLLASCEIFVPEPTQRVLPSLGLPAGTETPDTSGVPAPTETGGPAVPDGNIPPVSLPLSWETAEYDPRRDSDPNFVHGLNDNMCATEDTVYFAYGESQIGQVYYETICYFDKATGIVSPLCGKPECTHDSETCNAYIASWSYGLSIHDRRLYWVMRHGLKLQIYSVALDGTDRQLVRELDQELLPSEALTVRAVFHRGWFYLLGDYNDVSNAEANRHVYAAAWPLDPEGEGAVILDEALGRYTPYYDIKCYGDAVYLMVNVASAADRVFQLFRWSPGTGALETLYNGRLSFDFTTLVSEIAVGEDGVWALGTLIVEDSVEAGLAAYEDIICRLNLEDGTVEKQTLPERFDTRYGEVRNTVYMTAGLVVMAGQPEEGVLAVLAQDLDGNILLDQTYQFEGLFQNPYGSVYYCGRDETNLYLYRSRYKEPAMLIAVALDGSGAAILWDGEMGVH